MWETLQRPSMETPKHHFNARVCTSPWTTSAPSAMAFLVKPPMWTVGTVPPPEAPEIGADQRRQLSSPMAGLKPSADGIRSASPFGLPKREGEPERTSRRTGGVASSQVDPPRGGTAARVQRHGRLRNRSPYRPPSDLQPRLSHARLNGCQGALAEVLLHGVGGCGRRVPDAAPTGVFDAAKVVQPAYPVSYTGAGEGWPPPPLRSPHESRSRGGRGRGLRPLPPVPMRRDA